MDGSDSDVELVIAIGKEIDEAAKEANRIPRGAIELLSRMRPIRDIRDTMQAGGLLENVQGGTTP